MLRLPPLTEAQLTRPVNEKDPDANHPLRHCLHLYKELDDDLADFESARVAKVQQSHEKRDGSHTSLPKVSPRSPKKTPRTARLSLAISSKTANPETEQEIYDTYKPNEPKRENLSGVGNWLDCRAFATNEATFLGIARQKKKIEHGAYKMTNLTPGERFFLRKCKDALLARYGCLKAAFSRLDINQNKGLSMLEFCASVNTLLKEHESRVLYMYLDQDHNQTVTMNELCGLLEVC